MAEVDWGLAEVDWVLVEVEAGAVVEMCVDGDKFRLGPATLGDAVP